ncbi:MAG: TetR/AcrR family transcriptional regulator [Acidobacteria bacterium]|nr:TetR/AcrR family transcriptional regulator [Acidobacteriota bacterium]
MSTQQIGETESGSIANIEPSGRVNPASQAWFAVAGANGLTTRLASANFTTVSQAFFISETDAPAKRTIMVEALRLFSRKGLRETTIRDIAAAAGYSNPALYKHFSSKDELALELFVACYRECTRALDAKMSVEKSFDLRLRALVRTYTASFDEYPDAVMFAVEHLARFWSDVPRAMKKRTIITLIRELIELGESEGRVPRDIDIEVRVAMVAGALGQLSRLVYLGGMSGPASKYNDDLESTLRRALS